jgi:hypothetical protein
MKIPCKSFLERATVYEFFEICLTWKFLFLFRSIRKEFTLQTTVIIFSCSCLFPFFHCSAKFLGRCYHCYLLYQCCLFCKCCRCYQCYPYLRADLTPSKCLSGHLHSGECFLVFLDENFGLFLINKTSMDENKD